jgi:hypothetical protein
MSEKHTDALMDVYSFEICPEGGKAITVEGETRFIKESDFKKYKEQIAISPILLKALQKAVADYGKPGGPWNVPSEPGTWLHMAQTAIANATVTEPPKDNGGV